MQTITFFKLQNIGDITMDGIQYLKNCCEKLGIDYNYNFILGRGKMHSRTQYVFDCRNRKILDSTTYAIKYFEIPDIYIAWKINIDGRPKVRKFTITKDKIDNHISLPYFTVIKNVEYSGWKEETVHVFNPEGIENFLKSKM